MNIQLTKSFSNILNIKVLKNKPNKKIYSQKIERCKKSSILFGGQ